MLARIGCALCLFLSAVALAQNQQAPQAEPSGAAQQTPEPQLRTGTQLVLVDVVVQDTAGKPIRNLPREVFHIAEGKQPQTLAAFDEHSTGNVPKPGPAIPPMPPGTFSDYTPVPEGGALNVLLVDALNTPIPDQAYLQDQLKAFVNKLKPGMRVAIFGLNTRLYMLQGFTSDPITLKQAVNHKLLARSSTLMANPASGQPDASMDTAAGGPVFSDELIAANLRDFEASEKAFQLQFRIEATLDAFNALAHYLSAFPGRKNLLWFSGSFPVNFLPDPSLPIPSVVAGENGDEFRDTTGLLTRSEVAVYPIDAKGLVAEALFTPGAPEAPVARTPAATTAQATHLASEEFDKHATMNQMAAETGGHAFYNTNGLTEAAAEAIETGGNYYTLAYTPTDRNDHGEFRTIHVEVSGPQVPQGLKLAYRPGYYAEDPRRARRQVKASASDFSTPGNTANPPDRATSAALAYRRAAMAHGAPTPQDILFKVRVLPAAAATETALIADDTPNPDGSLKGPFRRYNVDFAALGSNVHLTAQPDGNYKGAVEFNAFVYDRDGKLLNRNSKTVELNLKPAVYKHLQTTGMNMHIQVSTPARDESYLRLSVHDIDANHYGVVELSTASVINLPPPAPSPAAKAPPPAAAAR